VSGWYLKGQVKGQHIGLSGELIFDLEPDCNNRKKGANFRVTMLPEELKQLRDLCDGVLKEIAAAKAIDGDLNKYKKQLDQERTNMIAKKRAELRKAAGLDPDEQDKQAEEQERKDALDILDAMQPQKKSNKS
jgi:hypothetical protein